ncbi:MAG: hypothetical protein U1E78_01340 [Gammaproteobacteria bacterium]
MIFRVGAERSSRRSVHKVHDCGGNREGNNPENSAVKGIYPQQMIIRNRCWAGVLALGYLKSLRVSP